MLATRSEGQGVGSRLGTPVSIAIERETFHEMKWGGREKYPAVGRRSSRCRLRRVVLSWQYFSLHCVFSLWVWAAPASPDRRWMAAAALTPLGTNASTLRYWWHGITTEQVSFRGPKITYMLLSLPVINVPSWFMNHDKACPFYSSYLFYQ